MVGRIQPFATPGLQGMAEVQDIPIDDDGGEQVETGYLVVLALGSAVADLALSADAQGVLQRVMRFASVQAHLSAALRAGVEDPFDNEQRSLDPADFAQGGGQVVLARIAASLRRMRGGTTCSALMATMIVICPCALVIAAPLAHVRATTVGARRGVRIADPAALEALAEIRTAIFDKAGTLTLSRLRIQAVEPTAPFDVAALLEAAAIAERGSDHPIARALAGDGDGPPSECFDRHATDVDQHGRRIEVVSGIVDRGDGRTWLTIIIEGGKPGRLAWPTHSIPRRLTPSMPYVPRRSALNWPPATGQRQVLPLRRL